MSERVLCVGAHADDECFGCLGTLLKHKEAGDVIEFIAFASSRGTEEGAKKVAAYFLSQYTLLTHKDQQFDTYALATLMAPLEAVINTFTPTIVYMPFIGDLNLDHRLISEATMVLCRPYKNNAPKEVWMYEIPGTTELGMREFKKDKNVLINMTQKESLIKQWYPNELINGRDWFHNKEYFERWPRI